MSLFLEARELQRKHEYRKAAERFERADVSLTEPVLLFAASMNAAQSLYRAGRFEEAKGIFWHAQNFASSRVQRGQINEWIERCDLVGAYTE